MLAAIFRGDKNIKVEDVPLREIKNDELLIKVHACGVCGTDHHIVSGEAHSIPPIILGHEFAGVVVEAGSDTNNFMQGDHVAVDPNISCGYCEYCLSGKPNHCRNLSAIGVDTDGGFAEFCITPSKQAYKVPKELPLEYAAFAEPLSCCIHGINKAEISYSDQVVIIGGGSIGQLMIQLAKLKCASKIILIEPIDSKRELGLELGADLSIDPEDINLKKKIKELASSKRTIVFECVGKSETAELSVRLAGRNGTVLLFGLAPANIEAKFNLQYLLKNEISILGSVLNPFTFQTAIDLIVSKKIKLEKLITEKVALTAINQIFESRVNSIVKHQVINNNQEE